MRLWSLEAETGLALLPEPSSGDIFLDLEGDPFVGRSGLEYLFGYLTIDEAGKRNTARCGDSLQQRRSATSRVSLTG